MPLISDWYSATSLKMDILHLISRYYSSFNLEVLLCILSHDDTKCARSCEPGSRCHPNECIFGSGELRGVGILEWGVYEPGEGNGQISLRATWAQGGRILSQQGGFQVSKGGTNGEQKGMEKSKKQGDYSGLVVIYAHVHNECL